MSTTLEGTLSKWTNVMKGWQYRFFVLDENAGLLSYYTSKEKMMKGVRRGCVRLKDAVIGIDDQEDNTFTITVDHKTFHFQAQHSEEREKWVRRLEDTIRRHANRSRLWDNQSTFYLGGYQKDVVGNKRANHLELLGRRVSEADAYLQLIIEQTNKINARIENITDAEEKAKCKALQDNANAMLDHIKHSIVSLQIAKNMAHPINGIYNGPIIASTDSNSATASPTSTNAATSVGATTASKVAPLNSAADATASGKLDASGGEEEEDSTTENGLLPQTLPRAAADVHELEQQCSQYKQQQLAEQQYQQLRFRYQYSHQYNNKNVGMSGPIATSIDIVDIIADGIAYGTAADIATAAFGATTAPLAVDVPETSYSSSEDEEDFYDANDDPFTSMGNSPSYATRGFSVETTSPTYENAPETQPQKGSASVDASAKSSIVDRLDDYQTALTTVAETLPAGTPTSATASTTQPLSSAKTFQKYGDDDGSIDYDALYEEEEDSTISMEAHGSMISHLISQVKIGMDLTKVVLPTFILERRSLLEMYADYFAHPDLFLRIAEMESPRERIVETCRWYLSAYHAGRKSAVAKKPYNPILGEVFQCYWDLPGETPDEQVVKDGPVPWCHRNQLTFLAEQVSHHPPISAFYAEHVNKKITFSAHVWTKSKFLGLSIGVHNIGEGIVTLVDHSEEYIVTFPNGYGRSILTVPWIELGGTVEIRCPQTGYHATIEFLTKPFYGGKRNKVTAEIYAPNEKKPFVSIAGEWSGLMEAKWHDKNKTEVFVDVNRIPIFKKQVRPIVEQEEYESRRVWKEVTAGLKFNDIEKATNAKCAVEQIQRDEAKNRKDTETQWEHKYFRPVGDNWIYAKPLSQRVYQQEKESKR
ncbi:PREDICTED: oxysterol-binding protein-related protein 9 isoform X1 [Bactrocera latifrons]|uniref:Oxysterol-binding protein n=1 Tax=Bactrocera latifrons TaxID=174628 RepID=A0A0K8VAR0_BACLA|nr:PREDICTED: oxysterol-binding protein-related protein 9 isoform X1 [Bactrocera latifrons]XP_018792652.1 PREDICTED: oxysterol-binding protein-related protein 9 isoform X1 [Bactrocera latifrons]